MIRVPLDPPHWRLRDWAEGRAGWPGKPDAVMTFEWLRAYLRENRHQRGGSEDARQAWRDALARMRTLSRCLAGNDREGFERTVREVGELLERLKVLMLLPDATIGVKVRTGRSESADQQDKRDFLELARPLVDVIPRAKMLEQPALSAYVRKYPDTVKVWLRALYPPRRRGRPAKEK
jgi:hypothetical protein